MKRIYNEWRSFENSVLIPIGASRLQRREMRRAFYAGAQRLFAVMVNGASDQEDVTEADLQMMEGISQELDQFARDVRSGKA
jgi:hypothetical protein